MPSRDIEDLHPDLQQPCRDLLAKCDSEGINAKVIFTYRTPEEQDDLYAQGRTIPGRKVTNIKGAASKHCFTIDGNPAAKAFDIAVFDERGGYIEDGNDKRYWTVGKIGEALGLTWGGRWKSPHDPSHFQL